VWAQYGEDALGGQGKNGKTRFVLVLAGFSGSPEMRVHGGLWLIPPFYSRSGIVPPVKRSPD
jgi:hypothetical protein